MKTGGKLPASLLLVKKYKGVKKKCEQAFKTLLTSHFGKSKLCTSYQSKNTLLGEFHNYAQPLKGYLGKFPI